MGTESDKADAAPVRVTAIVRGRVQGVGFRWAVQRQALRLGLAGWARNLPDRGRVEVVAEGSPAACDELLAWLRGGSTPGHVTAVGDIRGERQGVASGFLAV